MYKFIMAGLFLGVMILSCGVASQSPKAGALKWMTLQEAETALQKEKRPILIDLYTDWCGWCKTMDKRTYGHPDVIAYLQRNFYPVKLNAETKTALTWNKKQYTFNAGYQTNEFAVYLTRGQLSYPTTVIIPADGTEPQAIPGFHPPQEFELLVKYFGEGAYNKTAFTDFQRSFKSSW
jgi:thioredoxin-related protein